MRKPNEELGRRLYELSDAFLAPGQEVRLEKVAEVAGVPRATVYYYFSGKTDLMAFLLERHIDHGAELLKPALSMDGSPTERMRAVLGAMIDMLVAHPVLCTHLLAVISTGSAPVELMASADEQVFAPVRSILQEGQDVGEFRFTNIGDTLISLMGALMMVAMMRLITSGQLDAEEVRTSVIDQLLRGIGDDTSAPSHR
jgi:TetR/AcrR family transcriptional regulator